ncbi:MAG TPA: site-specific integrase [Candidatus Limnocylindrales bacterium]|nr:site-specific integrase [Candidatus Limnocylindrales bacterium]
MQHPPKFTGENAKILTEYQNTLQLQQLRKQTIDGYLWKIYTALKHFDFKPADKLTKQDVREYILYRGKNNKQRTLNNDIIALRKLFGWLKPGNDFFGDIKVRQPKNYLPVEQLITPEDVKKLIGVCKSQRDRAIIMLLWDSGCRLNEVMSRNINHIQIDEYGATMIVDGKTGMRKVRLIDSLPDVRLWLNQHPLKNKYDAPLFVTERRYNHKEAKVTEERRVDQRTVQNMLNTVAKLAGLNKNVHPHALRHGRLTMFVRQGFMESELRILAGWEKESNMPATYVHLAGADVDKKLLIKNGLITDDEELILKTLKPGKCPRCATDNSVDAKYCSICGLILDQNVAKDINEKTKAIPGLLAALQHDPEFLKLLTKHL